MAALKQQRRCEGSLIWFEARGEGIEGQRGVLDVARNRAEASGKTLCEVVAEKGQFVWYKNNRILPLDEQKRDMRMAVAAHQKVLTSEKWFYSGPSPSWANHMVCRVIGHLHFCKEKK